MGMYMKFLYLPVFLGTIIIMVRLNGWNLCAQNPRKECPFRLWLNHHGPSLHHDSARITERPRTWWGTSVRTYLWMGSAGCITGLHNDDEDSWSAILEHARACNRKKSEKNRKAHVRKIEKQNQCNPIGTRMVINDVSILSRGTIWRSYARY